MSYSLSVFSSPFCHFHFQSVKHLSVSACSICSIHYLFPSPVFPCLSFTLSLCKHLSASVYHICPILCQSFHHLSAFICLFHCQSVFASVNLGLPNLSFSLLVFPSPVCLSVCRYISFSQSVCPNICMSLSGLYKVSLLVPICPFHCQSVKNFCLFTCLCLSFRCQHAKIKETYLVEEDL